MNKRQTVVVLVVAIAAVVPVLGQTAKQRALDLYNAGARDADPRRQVDLFRQSIGVFETFEGSVALGDALLRMGGDPQEARRVCGRAFSTLANPDAPQGKRMQATALVCLARTYRATKEPGMATTILKRSIAIERTPVAEQELRELTEPGFKPAEAIARELDRSDARGGSGGTLPRGALPIEVSADVYINFDFDKATLTSDGVRQVGELARALNIVGSKGAAPARFKVIGHSDTRGADEYNLDLSRRRAKTVADLLVSRYGVATSAVETEGKGKREPLLTGDSDEVHAHNRRVEVQLIQ